MLLLWLTRLLSFTGFCLLTIGAIFPEWERSSTGETIGLWQACVQSNLNSTAVNVTETNDAATNAGEGSGQTAESTDLTIEDAEPEPVAEPECTYKTNDLLNDESWLLVCSTVGCAFAGAGCIILCMPRQCLYYISADLQIIGSLLYLVTVGVWMNQDSLSGEPRCYKTIGWALAVASSGIGVSFLNGLLSRFVANLMSANRYEPTEKSSNPYNDNEAETNTDLTSM